MKILIEGFTRNAVPRVVLYLFKGRIRITIPVTLDEINSIIFHKIFRISRAAGCEKGTIERFVRHWWNTITSIVPYIPLAIKYNSKNMTTVCIVRFMNRNYRTVKNKIRIKKKKKEKKIEKNRKLRKFMRLIHNNRKKKKIFFNSIYEYDSNILISLIDARITRSIIRFVFFFFLVCSFRQNIY